MGTLQTNKIISRYNLELFVKDIFVFECKENDKVSRLPIYADGYPGLIYLQTKGNAYLLPKGKELSALFLYGQTLSPVEISLSGQYRLIVFQLYPCATKLLFGIHPKKINDDCYDLLKSKLRNIENLLNQLETTSNITFHINQIASYLLEIAQKKGVEEYRLIQKAVELVEHKQGQLIVGDLAKKLDVNERTLERKFNNLVGIPPKKFIKIIQFQNAMSQTSKGAYTKLTDVVYENGYADQSHFIRNIKKFTGKKPRQLKS